MVLRTVWLTANYRYVFNGPRTSIIKRDVRNEIDPKTGVVSVNKRSHGFFKSTSGFLRNSVEYIVLAKYVKRMEHKL